MKNVFLKSGRTLRTVILTLLLVVGLVGFSIGSCYGAIVEPSSQFYITDEAGVISGSTEQYIVEKNGQLEDLCGGQIVVVVVDFLDGMDIEDYAYKIFNDWKIGDDDENNGILLLLTIGEENYWCMQGKGLENSITAGDLDEILWYYLEDDFAVGCLVRSIIDISQVNFWI